MRRLNTSAQSVEPAGINPVCDIHMLCCGGEIVALHVFEPLHGSVSAYVSDDAVKQAMDKVRAGLAERIGDAADVTPVIIKGHSGRSVTDYAQKEGADLIIVGSHKPGIGDYLLGSTSARIVRHAPCAVHVLR